MQSRESIPDSSVQNRPSQALWKEQKSSCLLMEMAGKVWPSTVVSPGAGLCLPWSSRMRLRIHKNAGWYLPKG